MLTEPGDIVLDMFSGSNTTGAVAERLNRRWLAFEISRDYGALSAVRLMQGMDEGAIRTTCDDLLSGRRVDFGHRVTNVEQV
jgi:site-specific DNA-methyltransferase (cytosine-N4-specific)